MQRRYVRRHRQPKGQTDHIDAWLMSYADLITLLFMMFVILISVSVSRQGKDPVMVRGEPPHPYLQHQSGTLSLGTPYDEAYRTLVGVVYSNHADQTISVEKNMRGVALDMSAPEIFEADSASIPLSKLPLLKAIAKALKAQANYDDMIEVEGHTSAEGRYAGDWTLPAMQAAAIVNLLQEEGLDPQQLRATSYAGTQPLVPNRDAMGRPIAGNERRNQRIIIRLEAAPEAPKPPLGAGLLRN